MSRRQFGLGAAVCAVCACFAGPLAAQQVVTSTQTFYGIGLELDNMAPANTTISSYINVTVPANATFVSAVASGKVYGLNEGAEVMFGSVNHAYGNYAGTFSYDLNDTPGLGTFNYSIESVSKYPAGAYVILDPNVVVTFTSPMPEPETWLELLLGMAAVGVLTRSRFRTTPAV